MNTANGPPGNGRRFYFIMDNGDGTADVILNPRVEPMTTPEGATDYDISGAAIVQGVEYTPELEADIRARFYAWCASGEPIDQAKGEEIMDKDNLTPENELEIELEPEGEPEEPQTDAVYILDGRGRQVRLEVPDDEND